jgi:hypothetical protein
MQVSGVVNTVPAGESNPRRINTCLSLSCLASRGAESTAKTAAARQAMAG